MPEEKKPAEAYVGKVYCSFCGGYDRRDGSTRDVFSFAFYGGRIPEGKVAVVCPNCFLEVLEKVLGKEAKFVDGDACAIDWSGAFRV